jgi:hypothetical protein
MYLRFLHCSGNKNEHGEKYDWLTENEKLSDTYAKYYSPTEHFAVKIIVLFKSYFQTLCNKETQIGWDKKWQAVWF